MTGDERVIAQLGEQLIQQLVRAERLTDELAVAAARIVELEAAQTAAAAAPEPTRRKRTT